jgi:hypothetical protein
MWASLFPGGASEPSVTLPVLSSGWRVLAVFIARFSTLSSVSAKKERTKQLRELLLVARSLLFFATVVQISGWFAKKGGLQKTPTPTLLWFILDHPGTI